MAAKPEDVPAATRPGDQNQHRAEDAKKASSRDHISKGPVIPKDMPPKASREEIEARMKELNQK